MQRRPLVSAGRASKELDLTVPTVNAALESLVKLHIVRETTGRRRGRVFAYVSYMKVLQEGTEPLSRRSPDANLDATR